jgi:hypothetical protein
MGELFSAYRGSLFGSFWLVAGALGLLAFYSVSTASIRNFAPLTNKSDYLTYPLFIFCGLIYFPPLRRFLASYRAFAFRRRLNRPPRT